MTTSDHRTGDTISTNLPGDGRGCASAHHGPYLGYVTPRPTRRGTVVGPWGTARPGPARPDPPRSRSGLSCPRSACACHACDAATRPPLGRPVGHGRRPARSTDTPHTAEHATAVGGGGARVQRGAADAAAQPATAAAASAALGSGGTTAHELTCTPAGRGKEVRARQENHGPKVSAVRGQSWSR